MAYITHDTIYNLCSLLPTRVAVAVAAYYYVLTSGPSLLVRVEMGRMLGPYPATIQLLLLSVLGARPYRRRANTSMRVKPAPPPSTHPLHLIQLSLLVSQLSSLVPKLFCESEFHLLVIRQFKCD